MDGKTTKRAADLLSQQIWCWGQDVMRPAGNWLLEVGFDRLAAPADRERCSSVYTLELPAGCRVVLRGFGVFFGDDQLGGVFLKRYEFQPHYTPHARLECPPWSTSELPALCVPSVDQRDDANSLTVKLIDWIASYEANVAEQLGVAYRQSTLDSWESNKRPIVPAAELAETWRSVGTFVAEDAQALATQC